MNTLLDTHPDNHTALAPEADYRDFIIDWEQDGRCYRATHVDYDGAPDANDDRLFYGPTRRDLKLEIDEWHESQAELQSIPSRPFTSTRAALREGERP